MFPVLHLQHSGGLRFKSVSQASLWLPMDLWSFLFPALPMEFSTGFCLWSAGLECHRSPMLEKLLVAEHEFVHLESFGIICPSRSRWASLFHIVSKANGKWRPYHTYRQLSLCCLWTVTAVSPSGFCSRAGWFDHLQHDWSNLWVLPNSDSTKRYA